MYKLLYTFTIHERFRTYLCLSAKAARQLHSPVARGILVCGAPAKRQISVWLLYSFGLQWGLLWVYHLPIFHQRDMHDIFSSFRLKKVSPLSHVTTAISEQPRNILYILSQFQVSDNDIRLEPGWAQHRLDAAPWLSCSQRWGHGGSWWILD